MSFEDTTNSNYFGRVIAMSKSNDSKLSSETIKIENNNFYHIHNSAVEMRSYLDNKSNISIKQKESIVNVFADNSYCYQYKVQSLLDYIICIIVNAGCFYDELDFVPPDCLEEAFKALTYKGYNAVKHNGKVIVQC